MSEIMKNWAKALRSGKYKQCSAYAALVMPDGGTSHCCLGVLGDILGERVDHMSVLPSERALDLIAKDLGVHHTVFVALNDEFRLSFDGIADFIDRILSTERRSGLTVDPGEADPDILSVGEYIELVFEEL